VIPTLNAAATLGGCLDALGIVGRVIVVDAESVDGTAGLAAERGAVVISAAKGRGGQIAAGLEKVTGWALILHADTILESGWRAAAAAHMAASAEIAAYFRFALDDDSPRANRLERAVAWRCRWLALPYGDQGLLIHRGLLDRVGGMRPLPLMEDVDLIRRIGRARLRALDPRAVTSAEKWRRDGWTRRSARNLFCLCLWFLGVPPRWIQRIYG
jgi:glycosyltransferase involved in cell wall biosynthesis